MSYRRVLFRASLILVVVFSHSVWAETLNDTRTRSFTKETPIISTQSGIASWYAGEFVGRLTANGEVFDPEAMTAAHKELPFGTVVRVICHPTGGEAIVRINDRGPYVGDRIIDLSRGAAEALGMEDLGIAQVTLEILYLPEIPESSYLRAEDTAWTQFQLATLSTPSAAVGLVIRLSEAGIPASCELTPTGMFRVSVRYIPLHLSDGIVERLNLLRITEMLKKADLSPVVQNALFE